MIKSVALTLLALASLAAADPTWPAATDDLEEIMYQLSSFKARKFSDTVSPCTNEASGPGRQNAAEWLRVGFHDMSTANTYFKTGGLDGSLQYELDNGDNTGPGHKTTLEFMSKYVSPRTSLSDLIAAGVYASVRSCGGPIIPVRGGRVDATEAGNPGVPQPQNSATMFKQQFDRMGFNNVEMIQVTACGHTLGGVHNTEFPEIVPDARLNNGLGGSDSTPAAFDNKVVTEYLDGTTTNPLVVGPAVKINKNSDFKVFDSDGNKTMETLRDNTKFKEVCKNVLQKMIEVVPAGVNLTEPIVPYKVKPVDLQLLLADGGANLHFSGYIRVKTTDLPQGSIKDLTITYKNRNGQSECGNNGCGITASIHGLGKGFDDTFGFFPIDAKIPVNTGISSFTVVINHADGTKQTADNNGHGFPIQDTILFQKPQSCILGSTGATTLVAAVRNDAVVNGAKATIHYKMAQKDSPVPKISSTTLDMTKGQCVGRYTLFEVEHSIEGGMAYQSFVELNSGDAFDSFNGVTDIGGSCSSFQNPMSCNTKSNRSLNLANRARTADPASPLVSVFVDPTPSPTPTPGPTDNSTSPTPPSSTPPSTPTPAPTPTHKTALGGYTMLSCWAEGSIRALSGAFTADDTMTNEKCLAFCKSYNYWGTEYGRECYCGNSLGAESKAAPLEQCNMPCGGDPTEYCGAGNRLELFSTTASITTPTGTLAHKPTIAPYTMIGCWAEPPTNRALNSGGSSSPAMTNEMCADYCKTYRYFGTEYGTECYCGSFLADDSKTAPLTDCNMTCGGDQFEYCGASNRLELYMNPNITGGAPEQPPAAGNFVLVGCQTEGNATRALADTSTAADNMTNEACGTFCKDYEYFGTEYGRECYCGNALAASSAVAPKGECVMLCAGSNIEYCGGSNRLSVYKKKPPVTPPPPPPPAPAPEKGTGPGS
ncbi:WSC domain containing protein [Akanthomyces lecanii RCEF 1005]|uniref:WSC domain containing protein n=1 Tax=Akanthomyces lecanii RCEF 1005 TaxID=1081108 RepID=A0A168HCD2_CORDF|nr:WSC domain containing protein [Akanthomyces lecanii RCEF 1005]